MEPHEDLAEVQRQRDQLAARVVGPWWTAALAGLGVAVCFGGPPLGLLLERWWLAVFAPVLGVALMLMSWLIMNRGSVRLRPNVNGEYPTVARRTWIGIAPVAACPVVWIPLIAADLFAAALVVAGLIGVAVAVSVRWQFRGIADDIRRGAVLPL